MAERSTKQIALQTLTEQEPRDQPAADLLAAQVTLQELADVFLQNGPLDSAALKDQNDSLDVEARLRALVEQMPAVIFMAEMDRGIGEAYVSPQIETMLGFSQAEWLEDPLRWYARIHPDDKERWSMEAAQMVLSGQPLKSEYRVIARDGRVIWFQCNAKIVRKEDGRPWFMHGVGFDITELKTTQERLVHDGFHDPLTNLPNRALFLDRLEGAIARARRDKVYKFAVLYIDIDRFKTMNDSMGHKAGDELIIQASQRILQSLRREDMVGRPASSFNKGWTTKDDTLASLGGDEFIVLLDNIRSATDSIRVASRIQESFTNSFLIGNQDVFATVSIGIAASSEIQVPAVDVLRDADIAMYRAKTQGKSRCEVFDRGMHQEAIIRLKLETDLRGALSRDEFRVHYQPIVSLATGTITGFEALLRWERPDAGLVPPGVFIQATEEMGLIISVGAWVLRTACEQVHRWHTEQPRNPPLTMSVNVSGRQFAQPDIVEQVENVLRETQVEPSAIKLEITESVAMGDAERTIKIMNDLRKLGIHFSIDDFGTGYSSLSYLRRFPIDTLKIDRSFVHDMATDPEKLAIVRTIISLARNLGMDLVAEGVETPDEMEQLKAMGCDFGQGYLFSKPVDCERANALLVDTKSLIHPLLAAEKSPRTR